ncbi:GNAT family N-acetyltransferase [Streptomyces sp. NC-S4]
MAAPWHGAPRPSAAGWFECGITIGAEHRRKGYAAEAAVMPLRFMFEENRYHKGQVRIFAHNEASLALHRQLGFVGTTMS